MNRGESISMRVAAAMQGDHARRVVERCGAWFVLIASLITYWICVDKSASYWDCPEYILVGSQMEVGHPPGNPVWMLMARVASLFAPSPGMVALTINLTSGLMTALAVMLVYLISLRLMRRRDEEPRGLFFARLIGALVGSLAFAWCDTAWFSAVESEVYAFSIFCTALCVWLMLRWRDVAFTPAGDRLLILTAYIAGLSLGVHQLNLLVLPTLALIYVFRCRPSGGTFWRSFWGCVVALVLIGLVLYGLMPGSVDIAGLFELVSVNDFNLPYHSGVVIYGGTTLLSFVVVYALIGGNKRFWGSIASGLALWLSGLLVLGGNVILGGVGGALMGVVVYVGWPRLRHKLEIAMWSLGMVWLGFASYGVILIRGAANPPINEGAPTDIFAFKRYLSREQYGSKPLLRGHTPFSQVLRTETIVKEGEKERVSYSEVWRKVGSRRYAPAIGDAVPLRSRALLDSTEFAYNDFSSGRVRQGKDAYLIESRKAEYRYTPELEMWLPRITSRDAADLKSYEAWSGMTASTMDSVWGSEVIDSTGRAVGKLNVLTGEREKKMMKRPTYMQNLRYLFAYQIGYMYGRYLMWNFSGRQNYIHATGEADNGNFLTGIPVVDDAMLGPQKLLPASHSSDNPGHHVYFLLPLLLGFIGLGRELCSGREGRRSAAIVGSLFIMMGVVIVLYVNQTPGEPRERDYSYIGSFMAFAIWIGVGAMGIVEWCRRIKGRKGIVTAGIASVAVLGLPVWLCASNFKDHNRRDTICRAMAVNSLAYLEKDAILFVNGDNYTFPLWYAREVERIRPDVRVVNLIYLSTPWYVKQLMMSDRESAPLPMTATAADIAYDNYIMTLYGAVGNSPSTREAGEVLRELYSNKGKELPRLNADTLLLPGGAGGEKVKVAVSSLAKRKSIIGFGELIALDIISTNASTNHPRPVYWLNPVSRDNMVGLADYTVDEGLARRYTGRREVRDSIDAEKFYDIVMDGIPRFEFGIKDRRYPIEPTSAVIMLRLRQTLLRLGSQLLREKKYEKAVDVAKKIERELPREVMEHVVYTDNFLAMSEGTELGRIYGEAGRQLGREDLRQESFRVLKAEIERLGEWRQFYNALPAWRRRAMSVHPKLERGQFYAPIALWFEYGGTMKDLLTIKGIGGVDLEQERLDWEKTDAMRKVLLLCRFPKSKEEMEKAFKLYASKGGRQSDLKDYPEAVASDYLQLLPE